MGHTRKGKDMSFSLYQRLDNAIEALYDDELEVLAEVAEALKRGQETYGRLDLAVDPRDFYDEAFQEERDNLAYRAMEIVKERRLRGPK